MNLDHADISNIPAELLAPYNPQNNEPGIYKKWLDSGFFNPDNLPDRAKNSAGTSTSPGTGKTFTIIMPPPNANGHLHAGHAMFITIQDCMIRYKRMRGYKTLWVPGADHAGFETQIVYEKKLEKEGRSRFKMEPKQLYEEILAFTLENKKHMEDEVASLGASCDWSREKFTLDPDVIAQVHQTFKKMYDDGLVYRGKRIINWCSKHQTSLSDVETENKEQKDPFYYFQYGPFVIGTARPETKFGDKYVVMHPDDKRYSAYSEGQKVPLEWINGPITATVIKDTAIDMNFGTGVMTITPWHDAVDFGIAERHHLDMEQIIDERGKLLPIAGEFAGMKIAEARPKLVEKLKNKGLLVKVDENYVHNVPCCYKCGTAIEPQVRNQWFVKMQPLANLALKALDERRINFIPDNYEKIFRYWMVNTLDWNISRQIVWGISIPAKVCASCGYGFPDLDGHGKKNGEKIAGNNAGETTPEKCPKCGENALQKDTDTFDTWFSSGQWPLLTLGFPDGKDFKTFYPTDVMETGTDLIFKWIPRMVIFGLYLAKEVPFKTVYLHGLVNDAAGKKMSKSKGNVVNPQDLTQKYGTDALRIGLIIGNAPGSETALAENKIRGYRNFANKIWNATRFVLSNIGDAADGPQKIDLSKQPKLSAAHKKQIEEFEALVADVTADFDEYRLHLAAEKLYHYFWHVFADVIIEESKKMLEEPNTATETGTHWTLLYILTNSLKMLHPFMPFITEKVWSLMPAQQSVTGLLMIESWPQPQTAHKKL